MRRAAPAALALALAAAVMLMLAAQHHKKVADELKRPSTFFTDDTGARALLLVCRQLMQADVLRTPLDTLEMSKDTLVVAGPRRPISDREAAHLDDWLTQGGQLILATRDGWKTAQGEHEKKPPPPFLSGYHVTLKCADQPARGWRVGSLMVHMRGGATWSGDYEVLARAGDEILAVSIQVGRGRIVAICDPLVISNQSLRDGDNAVWLMSLLAGHGKILFDEYHQGFGDRSGLLQVTGRFLATPWGWAVGQLGLAALLTGTWLRARLGRCVVAFRESLRDPLVLLEARAGLLKSAQSRGLALEQLCAHLCFQLSEPGGRQADLSTLLERSAPPTTARLERLMGLAAQPKLSSAELLEGAQLACQIREELARVR